MKEASQIIKKKGKTWKEAKEIAKDKKEWRKTRRNNFVLTVDTGQIKIPRYIVGFIHEMLNMVTARSTRSFSSTRDFEVLQK